MSRSNSRRRGRVGKVSFYLHHGSWWLYFRETGQPKRQKVATTREEAEKVAAQVNAQLSASAPTFLSFTPIGVPELRHAFLEYHENVLKSSLMTISRYRAATLHLEEFAKTVTGSAEAHAIRPDAFAGYLRSIEVAANGHPNAARRKLRDKGVQFVLETCRAMYGFAAKRRHLPPYSANPFAELPFDRLKVKDAKPIFVFDAQSELAFFRAADDWAFPIHFLLAKTGLRVGEAVHLLIEEVDLKGGWLRVCNKPALGWCVKTGLERDFPLIPELATVLRTTIGRRSSGPVFLRQCFGNEEVPIVVGSRLELERTCEERLRAIRGVPTRAQTAAEGRAVWFDAGAVKEDMVRRSFIRIMTTLGHPEAKCPKSWRHSFATLLQDANVDPLIRQLTLGHRPTMRQGLGMTGIYTHTRPETLRRQIEAALGLWDATLELVRKKFGRGTE